MPDILYSKMYGVGENEREGDSFATATIIINICSSLNLTMAPRS